MTAFYNENDPYAAQWLRNLIAAGHIAPGVVDERSIEDIRPDELARYTQCHFFAGVGVWSYALRKAGWPDDRPIWTGSCPCQPFSTAGKGGGFTDERHLWPAFFHLIEQCKPSVVMGEQVASKDGLAWIDLVLSDLEGAGYAAGSVDICAAGVGAPHIRQRLYWMADTQNERQHGRGASQESNGRNTPRQQPERFCNAYRLADANDAELEGWGTVRQCSDQRFTGPYGMAGGVADAGDGSGQRCQPRAIERGLPASVGENAAVWPRPTNGHWRDADWLFCRDGKWRPVEPGTFPLAHGATARMGRLRAYGNAIVAQVAEEVIRAYLETK